MKTPISYMETLYGNPTSLSGNICDSLTTIISKSPLRILLKLCQMAVVKIFVLCLWKHEVKFIHKIYWGY